MDLDMLLKMEIAKQLQIFLLEKTCKPEASVRQQQAQHSMVIQTLPKQKGKA